MIEINKNILKKVYPPRPLNSKKYDFGNLIVIGGSEFYSGAPALSALAAFRAGADMARIIAPKRAADIIASFSPNLSAYPLKGDYLEKKHLAILITMTEAAKAVARNNTAVVIGGGAGRSKQTQEVILEYLKIVSVPVIIDADAIYAVAKKPDVINNKNFLITPHAGEFTALTGKEVFNLGDKERMKAVKEEALRLKTTILLKGKIDIISNGQNTSTVRGGNPFMTVGGTGDVLAGICGALMAKGIGAFDAASAASYINGKAGEIAAIKKKDGLIATDLIDAITEVIQ